MTIRWRHSFTFLQETTGAVGQIVTWLEGMKNWNLVAIKSTLNIGPLRQYFGMRSSCVRNMTTVWEDCENMTGNLCLCSSRLFCQSQQAFLPSVALSIQLPAFFGWNLVVLTWHLISGLHELSRTCHAYTQHPAPNTWASGTCAAWILWINLWFPQGCPSSPSSPVCLHTKHLPPNFCERNQSSAI